MKEKIKTVLSWKPNNKWIAAGAFLALLLLLIPLYRIALYCAPWYDDYSYGLFVKDAWNPQEPIRSIISGVRYCVTTQWWAWQGTFSSNALMALIPLTWGENLYFVGLWFLITILVVACFVLVKVLVRDVVGGDWFLCVILQVILSVLTVEMMHTARSGFFWYNGGMHYVGMHSLMILFVAVLVKMLVEKQKWMMVLWMLLSIFGAMLSSGANFVTALQGLLITLSVMFLGIILRKKRVLFQIPALIVYVIGFYFNITAPGNDKRAAWYVGWGFSPVKSVLESFAETGRMFWKFTGLMTFAVMILAAPFFWQLAKQSKIRFRFPLLIFLWSVCLYATGFTPSFYSLGNSGLGRTLNAVKITFQILLLFNEGYFIGWLHQYLEKKEKKVFTGICYWWVYPIIMACMLAVFVTDNNPHDHFSSWGAYYFVHTGDAYNYHVQYLQRLETIRESGPDVVVEPYFWNPWTIRFGDLSEDPEREENSFMAKWYGKHSIAVRKQE